MISIVGAGPAGSYLAYLLAKEGKAVRVLEEHKVVGAPIQCTGIVTDGLFSMIERGDFIVNVVKGARIFSPNGEFIEVALGTKGNTVMDRMRFDQAVMRKAEKAGAEILLNHRFDGIENGNILVYDKENSKTDKIKTEILVGADGPNSPVAKAAGIYGTRKNFLGVQATVKLKNENFVDFYPWPDGFGWVVPESPTLARVGIAAYEKAVPMFQRFVTQIAGEDYLEKIVARQGGLIPVYGPKLKTQAKNVFLVGDAATHVKATTAGGIIQGMLASEELADTIINGGDYEKKWKKRVGKDLYLSLIMRRVMDKFSNDDYNYLVRIFQKPKNREILEKFDRDYPSRFLFKLLLREPRFLVFAKLLHKFRLGDFF